MAFFDSLPRDTLLLAASGVVIAALYVWSRAREERRRRDEERETVAHLLDEVRAALADLLRGQLAEAHATKEQHDAERRAFADLDRHVRAVFRLYYALAKYSGLAVDKLRYDASDEVE